MQKTFEALASTPRRRILAYLSKAELNAGEIAARFEMSKPAVSQHLSILENAGLISSEKRGQFVYYRLIPENLVNTLNSYVQEVCPVSRPLKRESAELSGKGDRQNEDDASEPPTPSGGAL
ncbi:MAG: transcriptional regulator [Novosphingobium sp. 28-62-57]|uniref:metalloregulator ArsR/SmtB family transcription factor n=1 Tax=unclassified Novosphingobium TaxID=2644732 RepID=UPI000BD2676C|nr:MULTISPECIES: metalloregulator ArsR/SmtB family transcription factor [unclassified Novosphingobium]OYW48730.1 MAG: transcriptional regulator [Novosphingobium sp. 12-62-10]OYZ08284.1 MAG: transcriptional regulator [Novosphingobium sp. 28-62-57]OZA36441.1 MAG: transcriptional regulator [Novosphingobium sp. 17-62-9]HQS70134.1 metalloregulator ArsR/SmtB family transcription factor [Novosphingobium sp.]